MSGNDNDTRNQQSRKPTPIKTPLQRRISSSHDLLSTMNTLDSKPKVSSSSKSTPSSLSSSRTPSQYDFPIKTEKLPKYFTGIDRSDRSFDDLLKLATFSDGTDSKDSRTSKTESSPSTASISKIKTERNGIRLEETTYKASPVKCPAVSLACFQYRQHIVASSNSVDSFTNLKLTFVQQSRVIMLSAELGGSLTAVSIPYSKILRYQFIRKPKETSADWIIDLVLSPDFLNLKEFKLTSGPSSEIEEHAFAQLNTLRINLDRLCGMSADVVENCLFPIISDRKACRVTETRDSYGTFEQSHKATSPPKPSPKTCKLTADYSSRIRVVPSFESLSASDSVRLKGSNQRKLTDNPSFFSSPDVFEGRRTSKRLRGSSSGTSSPASKNSFTYVDPDFETDCIKLFSYPEGEIDSIQVTSNELQRLDPGIWLNDTLIDFELKYLFQQMERKLQDKIHIYSSFFYRRLSSPKVKKKDGQINTGFDMVKSWTRKIDIFDKDYLVVPLNENLHWYLAIICFPSKMLSAEPISEHPAFDDEQSVESSIDDDEKSVESFVVDLDPVDPIEESSSEIEGSTKVLIFDSLGLASRAKGLGVINRLRAYLQSEAQDKLNRATIKSACTGHICKVPHQENYTDCGCFLLQFVEEFFKAPQPQFLKELSERQFDLSTWFPPELAQNRRQIMKQRIESLAADYAERQKLHPDFNEVQDEDCSSDIEEIEMT